MHRVTLIINTNDENVAIGEHLGCQSEIKIDSRQDYKVKRFKHNIVNTRESVAYNSIGSKEPLSYQANALKSSNGDQAYDKT